MTRSYKKLPIEDVLVAIKKHKGNISYIAEDFDVPRSVIYLKIRAKSVLTQAMMDIKEGWKDRAQSNVADALERGERWATVFVITMLCADRGWVLPKNTVNDNAGQIDKVIVNGVTITGIEHNQFATPDMQGVTITTQPEPSDDDDDALIIEGELAAEASSDEVREPQGGDECEAIATAPIIADPVIDETEPESEPEPNPAVVEPEPEPNAPASKYGRVSQRLPAPDTTPEREPDPGSPSPNARG